MWLICRNSEEILSFSEYHKTIPFTLNSFLFFLLIFTDWTAFKDVPTEIWELKISHHKGILPYVLSYIDIGLSDRIGVEVMI